LGVIVEAPLYTLLLVDDRADNRDVLAYHLRRAGFAILTAGEGPEALDLLSRERIDLVLLDVLLPGMSGLEVLRAVRSRRSPSELPVIMVTALDGSPDVVAALDSGANDYVTKPLDFPVVIARVRAQLRSRRPSGGSDEAGSDLGPGSILEGRYRLEAVIGQGSFGCVYKATQIELERPVAIKVLNDGSLGHPAAVERFRREAVTACRVNHPNAVAILDYGVSAGHQPFLVMELLEGRSLAEELKQNPVLSLQRCVEILAPVCEALEAAHQAAIVHRDVKPANIFLHRASWGDVPKVLDFGIARILDEAAVEQQATGEGWIVGTPSFMAPERFGPGPVDGRADVWSVGVILFLVLSGRLPYDLPRQGSMRAREERRPSPTPAALRSLNPELPPAVEDVVQRALEHQPERRPSSGQLASDLHALVGPT
jgi:CheY-like chemotaxis protein